LNTPAPTQVDKATLMGEVAAVLHELNGSVFTGG
jgi:hypothetical protein